jgi:hypothetical protein
MHNETCVRVHIKIVLENNLTGPTHVVSGWDKKKSVGKNRLLHMGNSWPTLSQSINDFPSPKHHSPR